MLRALSNSRASSCGVHCATVRWRLARGEHSLSFSSVARARVCRIAHSASLCVAPHARVARRTLRTTAAGFWRALLAARPRVPQLLASPLLDENSQSMLFIYSYVECLPQLCVGSECVSASASASGLFARARASFLAVPTSNHREPSLLLSQTHSQTRASSSSRKSTSIQQFYTSPAPVSALSARAPFGRSLHLPSLPAFSA